MTHIEQESNHHRRRRIRHDYGHIPAQKRLRRRDTRKERKPRRRVRRLGAQGLLYRRLHTLAGRHEAGQPVLRVLERNACARRRHSGVLPRRFFRVRFPRRKETYGICGYRQVREGNARIRTRGREGDKEARPHDKAFPPDRGARRQARGHDEHIPPHKSGSYHGGRLLPRGKVQQSGLRGLRQAVQEQVYPLSFRKLHGSRV